MSLTPEERRRIYEEEKARIEAREEVRSEMAAARVKAETTAASQKRADTRNGCLVLLGIVVVLAIIGSLSNHSSSPPSPATSPAPVEHYWVAREVVSYDLTKLPQVPNWTNHRGPSGMTVQYKTRAECEMAFAEHQQLIKGNSEWECVGF